MIASLANRIRRKLNASNASTLPTFEKLDDRLLMSASSVIITEFMPDNQSTLADEDGDFSDWIEIHNTSSDPVDITGWHLTDDADDPTKYTFPATTLNAGDFLIVFASGKAKGAAGEELHTNFGLNNNGEYLALIQSNLTVNSEYLPGPLDYPSVDPDVSYGIEMSSASTNLVIAGDNADIHIPTAEVANWQGVSFTTDGSWFAGPTGVGFDNNTGGAAASEQPIGGASVAGDVVLAIDFNDRSNPGVTQTGFEPFIADGTTDIQTTDVTRTISGHDVTIIDSNALGYDDRLRATPTNSGGFDQSDIMRDFIFSRDQTGLGGLDVLVEGLTAGDYYTIELWSYDSGSAGNRQSDWTANGQALQRDYVFNGDDAPVSNDDYKMTITVQANASGELFLSGRRDDDSRDQGGVSSFGVFLNGLKVTEANAPVDPPLNPILRVDFNDDDSGEAGAANTEIGFETMDLSENGKTFTGGQSITISSINGPVLDDRDRTAPVDSAPRLTLDQLYDDFIFANGSASPGQGMQVDIDGLSPNTEYVIRLYSYGANSGGDRISDWVNVTDGNTETIDITYGFDGNRPPVQDGMNTMEATVTTDANGELHIQGTTAVATSHAVFLNALEIFSLGEPPLTTAIQTDVTAQMESVNAGAYLRLPFNVDPGTQFNLLNLNMKFDDGFVAYLNGTEVARSNAPAGTPLFNDTATDENPNGLALTGQNFNLTQFANLINVGGSNVLAIHGLNIDATDTDFLILPELTATTVTLGENKFFLQPTPGAANNDGISGFVGDTTFSHDRGFYDAPFDLEITSSTLDAEIYYTLNGALPTPETGILYQGPITIATTSTVRAVAFKTGFEPTNVDTQTYIFIEDVIRQDPQQPLDDSAVVDYEVSLSNTVNHASPLDNWTTGIINDTNTTSNLWIARQATNPGDDPFATTPSGIAWQSAVAGSTLPMLETTITGLTPGQTYQAYINFWSVDATQSWEVRAGLTDTNLTLYNDSNSLNTGFTSGNRTLFRGHIGQSIADPSGEIKIYIDDNDPTGGNDRTFFDSVGLLPGEIPLNPVANAYPTTWQANYPGDYSMDQAVVDQWDNIAHPENTDTDIRDALKSIPTMSLVMPHADFWDQSNGIYVNSNTRGDAWRRAASVEYFDPNSNDEFQVNAGLQIHGGASRDNVRTPKHSFRLIFNPEFDGPGQLEYDLFGDKDVDQYNTLVLKSFFTDGFPTRTATGRYSPLDSQYLRDTYMRDTLQAMGQLDTDSTYVHLYINGLYWGLYSPVERPDDAFLAEHFGGEREDYDIVKDFNELFRGDKTEWNQMFSLVNSANPLTDATYNLLQGLNPDGSENPTTGALLDIDNLIDYMISHLIAGPEDWPHHNWYAGRAEGPDSEGYKFYTWDQEIVLDGRNRDRSDVDNDNTPARLYNRLRTNEQFQIRWGDRMQMHLFNDGALTVEASQARWDIRSDEIEDAIIAESARWGDTRAGDTVDVPPSTVLPTMTVDLWRTENANVRDNYFQIHFDSFISRMQADGLYPTLVAPTFDQHGGDVTIGFELTITSPELEILYTTDGSDPMTSPSSIPVGLSQPILFQSGEIRARSFDGAGGFSALTKAFFTVDNLLRITEVHFNPAGPDDSEFIELQNTSNQTIDLTGIHFDTGVAFDFTAANITSLAPGEFAVITRNAVAFEALYGTDATARLAGEFPLSSLQNNGENIRLLDAQGGIILEFRYEDDWYKITDGNGPSLDFINPNAAAKSDWALSTSWRPSAINGTPGRPDPRGVALEGDFNYDGIVNIQDLAKLASNFNKNANVDPFPDIRWEHGDTNGDGIVNIQDLSKLASNFNGTGSNGFDLVGGAAASLSPANTDGAILLNALAADSDESAPSSWDHIGNLLEDESDDSIV